jgi:peptidoglycan/xylan/chitin deacetylase (PgdA/CDA1 family)
MPTHWIKRFLKRPQAVVLMYHRVADLSFDPWQLAVSPRHFSEQLYVLNKHYTVVSATELVRRYKTRTLKPGTVCITFDDGYGDNFRTARPLLENYLCPADFFIASFYIAQQQGFWWDELERFVFSPAELPSYLSLEIGKHLFEFALENGGLLAADDREKQNTWTWPNDPPTPRCALYLALWERLRPLPYAEIQAILHKLLEWSGGTPMSDAASLPMCTKEVMEMADHPLFGIGLHTATHPALALHSEAVQRAEIEGAKTFVQRNLSGLHNNLLTYPYGIYNDITLKVTQEQHLAAAFTTEARVVSYQSELYRLGRFQVRNWNGDQFAQKLQEWFQA